ncbi:hypothetical protein DSO57_1026253 [Entomophthora muscae]|uniref:Uncharacterized protein n=1 Tax=Entomophthora muscae TaxID=34485 RepID=A0ACC2UNF0_9FUNG|nr:hypothetical protein DSO57_1026253 [Entomophthora muscae]
MLDVNSAGMIYDGGGIYSKLMVTFRLNMKSILLTLCLAEAYLVKNLVNIYVRNQFRCAGVMYRGLVFTASTHVQGYPWDVTVGFNSVPGALDHNTGLQFNVSQIIWHPDVASKDPAPVLLKLDRGYRLMSHVGVAFEKKLGAFHRFTLLGWGVYHWNNTYREYIVEYTAQVSRSCTLAKARTESCFSVSNRLSEYVAVGSPLFNLNPQGYELVGIFTGTYSHKYDKTILLLINATAHYPWISRAAEMLHHLPNLLGITCVSVASLGRVCQYH